MNIFSKNLKNVFAKKFFLPFLFVVIFLVTFCFCVPYTFFNANALQNFNLNEQIPANETQENNSLNNNIINNKTERSFKTLPTEYSLYNIKSVIDNFSNENKTSTAGLPTQVGAQMTSSLCWAFAVNTALETTLYKSGVASLSDNLNFSEIGLAYATQVINRGNNSIAGGNFDLAYEYLSSNNGAIYQQDGEGYNKETNASAWTSDINLTNFYATKFLSTAKQSNYRVLEAVSYPNRKNLQTEEEKQNLRNSIKSHIYNYGGVTASIYMNSAFLQNYEAYVCDNVNAIQNHMVTLVGWDDDYRLSYGSKTYVGAYIAQNSSGTNFGMNGYFYVMFDDALVESDVNGFSRVSTKLNNYVNYNNLENSVYNNMFLDFTTTPSGGGETSYKVKDITEPIYFSNIYKTQDVKNQYLSLIKVPTAYNETPTQFKVYALTNLEENNVITTDAIKASLTDNFDNLIPIKNKYANGSNDYIFTSNQSTYYTIEVTENINVSSQYFAIVIEYLFGTIPQLNNNDETLTRSYQFTYQSTNGLNWSNYYTKDNTALSILPMNIQMEYQLDTIKYSKNDTTKIYDKEPAEITINVETNCSYNVFYSLTGEENSYTKDNPQLINSGEYNVHFKIEANFYETVYDTIKVKIDKKDIVVTPISNQSKIYGDVDHPIDYITSENVETSLIRGRLSREKGENVGSYQILQGGVELNPLNKESSNYNLQFNSAPVFFKIVKRQLIIVPNFTSKIYGDSDPVEITYSYTNVVTNEIPAFTGMLQRSSGKDVGFYDVNLGSLLLEDNLAKITSQKNFFASNYNLVLQNGSSKFEIVKRELFISPTANQYKIYGEKDPTFSFVYSNNVSGETPNFTGSLSRISGEETGRYNYLLGTLAMVNSTTFSSSNYNIVLKSTDNYFAITFGALEGCELFCDGIVNYNGNYYTVTLNSSLYDDVTFSYSINDDDYIYGGDLLNANNLIKLKDAGTYKISIKFSKTNYADVILTTTLTINPLNLVVTPNENQSKVYGELFEELTFTYSGVVEGETPMFKGKLAREVGEDVGNYIINLGTETNKLTCVDNANFKAQNYNLVFSKDEVYFEITPRELLIIPDENLTKFYNTEDINLTYTFSNAVEGETPKFEGNLAREAGEDVGNYIINLGTETNKLTCVDNENFLKANYVLKVKDNAVFRILPAEITVSINSKQGYYGQEIDKNFTYNITNNSASTGSYKEGDNLKLAFICGAIAGSLKGTYPITCVSNNPNYNVTVINGEYSILYSSYTVTFMAYNNELSTLEVEHFYSLTKKDFPQLEYKTGYEFDNWVVISSSGTFDVVQDGYIITQNTTIIAVIRAIKYSISYILNGGEFISVINYYNYNIETPTFTLIAPTKKGFTFGGWYLNANFVGEPVSRVSQGSTGEKTFYAKWNVNTYQISFNTDANLPYTFAYNGETSVQYDSSFKFSVILKTEYTQSYNKIKVYAKLLNNSSSQTEVKNINNIENEDNKILLTANDNGIYTLENISGNYQIYCENITLNVYSIFFLIDNNLVKQISKNHGEALNSYEYPIIPEKANYNETAPYWDIASINKVDKNEVIVAKYVPNVQVITFVLPDGTIVKTNVNYGENASLADLENAYHLGILNYYTFDASLNNITEDKIIRVGVGSNAYILYIVVAVVIGIVVTITTVTLVKKRKRDTFNWWVYTKNK